jgi:hypothetical protein
VRLPVLAARRQAKVVVLFDSGPPASWLLFGVIHFSAHSSQQRNKGAMPLAND